MKKLFLTSGLILCMACPAFATNDITSTGKDATDTTITANCTNTYLGSYTGPVSYEAKWTPISYTITYHAGNAKGCSDCSVRSAIGSDKTVTVEYDQSPLTVLYNTNADLGTAYSLTGYDFAGWRADKNITSGSSTALTSNYYAGGTAYSAGDSIAPYKVEGDTNMYAQWTPKCIGAFTLDSSLYPNPTATTATYSTSTTPAVTAASPASLYVKYDNGFYVNNTCISTTGLTNGKITIPSLKGYSFGGFYTGKANTGDQMIDDTGTITASGKTRTSGAKWYAKWTPKTYKIVYHAGNAKHGTTLRTATGTDKEVTGFTYDQSAGTALAMNATNFGTVYSLTGYDFAGWAADYNIGTGASASFTNNYYNGGQSYGAGASLGTWKVDGTVNMYAQWTPKTFTVTYDKGSCAATTGTHYADTNGATYDENYTIPSGAAFTAKTGYTFVGWNTATGKTTSNWSGETPWTRTQSLTVYAACTANTTTITYNCGSSNSSPAASGTWHNPTGWTSATKTVAYDETYSHPTGNTACTLSGYQFANWNCVTGTTGSTTNGISNGGISNGKWAVDNANVTCTAVWTPNTITTNWYTDTVANNGTQITLPNNSTAGSCTYDSTLNLPANPSKPGYTFNGWHARPSGS